MTSIEIAAAQDKDGKALVPEVCIFFENHLMRGNRTNKDERGKLQRIPLIQLPGIGGSRNPYQI